MMSFESNDLIGITSSTELGKIDNQPLKILSRFVHNHCLLIWAKATLILASKSSSW